MKYNMDIKIILYWVLLMFRMYKIMKDYCSGYNNKH